MCNDSPSPCCIRLPIATAADVAAWEPAIPLVFPLLRHHRGLLIDVANEVCPHTSPPAAGGRCLRSRLWHGRAHICATKRCWADRSWHQLPSCICRPGRWRRSLQGDPSRVTYSSVAIADLSSATAAAATAAAIAELGGRRQFGHGAGISDAGFQVRAPGCELIGDTSSRQRCHT